MARLRARSKLVIGLVVCAVAAAGTAAAVFGVTRGSHASVTATTGEYAPITVKRPKLHTTGGALLRDPDAGVQNYLNTMVTQLPGVHRYRVTISNVSNLGFIDALQWYPPVGVHVVKVTGSSTGRCALTGLTGFGENQFKSVVLYPNISCERVGLKPPSCTCLGDGGSVDISLVTDAPLAASGAARLIAARVVLQAIPSYLSSQASPTGTSGG